MLIYIFFKVKRNEKYSITSKLILRLKHCKKSYKRQYFFEQQIFLISFINEKSQRFSRKTTKFLLSRSALIIWKSYLVKEQNDKDSLSGTTYHN